MAVHLDPSAGWACQGFPDARLRSSGRAVPLNASNERLDHHPNYGHADFQPSGAPGQTTGTNDTTCHGFDAPDSPGAEFARCLPPVAPNTGKLRLAFALQTSRASTIEKQLTVSRR